MRPEDNLSRRHLLRNLLVSAALAFAATLRPRPAPAAEAPLIGEDDPAAKAVRYVEDVAKAKGASPGSSCANCALYQGKAGSKQGPCQIFPGKSVVTTGWCASWAPQM